MNNSIKIILLLLLLITTIISFAILKSDGFFNSADTICKNAGYEVGRFTPSFFAPPLTCFGTNGYKEFNKKEVKQLRKQKNTFYDEGERK